MLNEKKLRENDSKQDGKRAENRKTDLLYIQKRNR